MADRLNTLSRREIASNIAVVAQENETRFPVTVLEFVLVGAVCSRRTRLGGRAKRISSWRERH